MKGYVKGSLWGLVVGGVGLGVVSLVGEQPNFATGPDAPQMASPAMVPSVNTSTLPVPLPSSPDDVPNFADSVPLNVATPDAEAVPDVPTETAEAPSAHHLFRHLGIEAQRAQAEPMGCSVFRLTQPDFRAMSLATPLASTSHRLFR